MRKFSRRRRTQPTPPVCKAVPPPPINALPQPGQYAIAHATYTGPTTGAPIAIAAVITLTPDLTPGLYRGETITPNGTRIVLLARFPTPPPTTELQLFGFDDVGALLFSATGTGPITYNPWLTSEALILTPANPSAKAIVTLAQ